MLCVFGIMLSAITAVDVESAEGRDKLTCSKSGSVFISCCVTLGKTLYHSEPRFPLP